MTKLVIHSTLIFTDEYFNSSIVTVVVTGVRQRDSILKAANNLYGPCAILDSEQEGQFTKYTLYTKLGKSVSTVIA